MSDQVTDVDACCFASGTVSWVEGFFAMLDPCFAPPMKNDDDDNIIQSMKLLIKFKYKNMKTCRNQTVHRPGQLFLLALDPDLLNKLRLDRKKKVK